MRGYPVPNIHPISNRNESGFLTNGLCAALSSLKTDLVFIGAIMSVMVLGGPSFGCALPISWNGFKNGIRNNVT